MNVDWEDNYDWLIRNNLEGIGCVLFYSWICLRVVSITGRRN